MKKRIVVGVSVLLLVSFFGIAVVSAKSSESGNKSLQKVIDQYILRISDLENMIGSLSIQVNEKESVIQGLEARNATLADENRALLDENILLSNENVTLSDENAALVDENAKLADENTMLSRQYQELLLQNADYQNRLAYTDLWRVPLDKAALLGRWDVVGFCEDPMIYKPDSVFPWELYLQSVTFSETLATFEIEGAIYTHNWLDNADIDEVDKVVSRMLIMEIDEVDYLFYEWKSGDYSIRGQMPQYYVLKKANVE